MRTTRIIAVHLLNDFSGSPLVFSQALRVLQKQGYEIHLFTATPSGNGFLTNLTEVCLHPITYRWNRNRWITLAGFLFSQCSLFFKVLLFSRKGDLVYINSLLPFGAALAAKLRNSKVLYHIHEVSIKPILLKKWLLLVLNLTARQTIFVSEYVQQHTRAPGKGIVIYNSLPASFITKSRQHKARISSVFMVLMLCSLKKYKGVNEFIECARQLPDLSFELVLNSAQQDIDIFFTRQSLPGNLRLFPAQSDTHDFYERASVVVNLTLPDQWVETFGMTVLEAMYYHRPVIVPPVGGVAELVQDNVNGYYVNSHNINGVIMKLRQLSNNSRLYNDMAAAAYRRAEEFTPGSFDLAISNAIKSILKTGSL